MTSVDELRHCIGEKSEGIHSWNRNGLPPQNLILTCVYCQTTYHCIWDKTKEKQQESFTRLFDEVEMLRKAVYDAGSILSIAYDEINK